MGPAILLDKSAIQWIGQDSMRELSRYFYTVLPPELLMETLADLSLDPEDLDSSKKLVAGVARKLLPPDSISNLNWRFLSVADLLGGAIEMGRRPIVGGGRSVVSQNGESGILIDVQPENEALLRWRRGEFNETDLAEAISWRKKAHVYDLEKVKQSLARPPHKIKTLDELARFVESILNDQDSQIPMLDWLLKLLQCKDYLWKWVHQRWRASGQNRIVTFAPYAFHCMRVHVLFYVGMSHGLVGTKTTNAIDIQYLCYAPFAYIFCSGDKIHHQLAPLVLSNDQTFVGSEDLRRALSDLASARRKDPGVEPGGQSLVRQLWIRHWGNFAPQASRPPTSKERAAEIKDKLRPIMDAIRESDRNCAPPSRWPR